MTLMLPRFPLTRADAEDISHQIDLLRVETLDCRLVYSMSHCFADELWTHMGHRATVVNASEFVGRIVEAGLLTASRDW